MGADLRTKKLTRYVLDVWLAPLGWRQDLRQGGWGDGERPSPRTNKENPRLGGDFPETANAVATFRH